MPILTAPIDPAVLRARAGEEARLVVVVLCAAWCNTCGEFRATLEPIAAARDDVTFVWLDIEDDAALCGDVDVEDFPTLAAFRDSDVLYFGSTLPLRGVVTRLIDELAQRTQALRDVPQAVAQLAQALRAPPAS